MTRAEADRKVDQIFAAVTEFGLGPFNAALAKLHGRQLGIPHSERLALSGAVRTFPEPLSIRV